MGFWSPVTAGSGRLELEQTGRRVVVGLSLRSSEAGGAGP